MRYQLLAFFVVFVFICLTGCGQSGTGNNRSSPKTSKSPTVPTIKPVRSSCAGNNIGLYTWGQDVWNNPDSPMIDFLLNPSVSEFSCGDIYIETGDYSSPDKIKDEQNLIPFIRNVRATGNSSPVFLVYGDVQVSKNGVLDGAERFARTFFRWVNDMSQDDLNAILPIGISFDCEHLPLSTIQGGLGTARNLKNEILETKLGGDAAKLIIEWAIEGQPKPDDTDLIMKLADRALMMVYRNHMGTSVRDPTATETLMNRLFDFMFKDQCRHCLDDAYAKTHYRAKLRIMVEADCRCAESCHKISFCAFDSKAAGWGDNFPNGAEYLTATVTQFEHELRSGGRLSREQFHRLFGDVTGLELIVIHNWHWFTCMFDTPSVEVKTPIGKQKESCKSYHAYADGCRKSG